MPISAVSSTQGFEAHLEGGGYPTEVSWRVGEGCTTYPYSASPQTISLPPGENMLYMFDSVGDGWNGASWTLKETGGEAVAAGPYTFSSGDTFSSGASATQVFTAWTAAPTAVPTYVGDTHIPTASPTDAPTASPTTAAPTASPTPAPTAGLNNLPNWVELKAACSASVCDTANGGCTITLSDDFVMGSYIGEIDFSGKAITIWGQGQVLDASGGGRFFKGIGAGSSLELHDVVLQNGKPDVSGRVLVVATVVMHKLF
jgi:hypothetical protein